MQSEPVSTGLRFEEAQLLGYVERVLKASDEAVRLEEELQLGQFAVDNELDRFRTVIRPIANLAIDSTTRPRTGIEFSKHTRWGADISTGYATDGFGSGASSRSFARVGIPVFQRFGRAVNELPLTKAEIQQQRQQMEVTRQVQMLVAQAINQHIALFLIERTQLQAKITAQRAAENVESARARHSVGLVPKVDVHRAELNRLEQVEAFEKAQFDTLLQREDYAELARMDIQSVPRINDLPLFTDSSDRVFFAEQRLEWHIHLLEVKQARLDLQAAKRRLRPDLKLEVVWLGNKFGNEYNQLLSDQSNVYFALRMDSDLGFRSKLRSINTQEVNLRRIRRAGEHLSRRLQREVRRASATVVAEARRKELAANRQTEALSAVDIAKVRYDRGIASNLDVVDAEVALADAELGSLRAKANHTKAIVELALARGEMSLPWLQQSLKGLQFAWGAHVGAGE